MTKPGPQHRPASRRFKSTLLAALTGALLAMGAGLAMWQASAQEGRPIPAPTLDAQTGEGAATEVAILAGGCFWGVQGVFQHVEGVSNAVSGMPAATRKLRPTRPSRLAAPAPPNPSASTSIRRRTTTGPSWR